MRDVGLTDTVKGVTTDGTEEGAVDSSKSASSEGPLVGGVMS